MSTFKVSKVVFDEVEHSYTLGKKKLSGVTALLGRQIFQSKYDGVPKNFMQDAADRGSRIHRQIEMYESFGGEILSKELDSYIKLKSKNKFHVIETEWLVSDNKHVASSIDLIFGKEGEEGVYLYDTKTTSHLDIEYLSWQLSIYKYLFLLDNPDVKILGLGACWLPNPDKKYGRPKMVEVPEKPMEWVKELIECDARGEQWVNPEAPVAKEESSLAVPVDLCETIAEFLRFEKAVKDLKEKLKVMLEEHGVKKWECDAFTATITPAGKTSKFDSKAFAKDHPDLYDEYMGESERKSSIRITLK